jgi:hypothetical protein
MLHATRRCARQKGLTMNTAEATTPATEAARSAFPGFFHVLRCLEALRGLASLTTDDLVVFPSIDTRAYLSDSSAGVTLYLSGIKTQADAAKIRTSIARALDVSPVYNKSFSDFNHSWNYEATVYLTKLGFLTTQRTSQPAFQITMIVAEAPLDCRVIEEEYTVVERVPTAFEERTVTKTRYKSDCSS